MCEIQPQTDWLQLHWFSRSFTDPLPCYNNCVYSREHRVPNSWSVQQWLFPSPRQDHPFYQMLSLCWYYFSSLVSRAMASAHPPLQQFIELDMEELAEFVEEEISAHAATVVQECGLNGAAFLLLEESDIREQWTVLRERIHITQLWKIYRERMECCSPLVRLILLTILFIINFSNVCYLFSGHHSHSQPSTSFQWMGARLQRWTKSTLSRLWNISGESSRGYQKGYEQRSLPPYTAIHNHSNTCGIQGSVHRTGNRVPQLNREAWSSHCK